MALETYRKKRSFSQTPEPAGDAPDPGASGRFVVQKHAARRLHYDLRLEIGGTLKCWAIPRGPSLDPAEKRLAARTEDHPAEYLHFEKVIPAGQYGGGTMIVWDRGTFEAEGELSAEDQLARGELKFILHGSKLGGGFVLVRTQEKSSRDKKAEEWLLIKHRDAAVGEDWNVDDHPASVLSGRTLEQVRDELPPDRGETVIPAALAGAEAGDAPADLPPMLAATEDQPFSDPDWVFELKWDGVRTQARIENGRLRLISRNGRDVTSHYPELADLPLRVRASSAIVDGEIVALDDGGRSDFHLLQRRMHTAEPSAAEVQAVPVVYYAFDLPFADGYDLRSARLLDRKRVLRAAVHDGPHLRYSDHVAETGEDFFELAQELGAEGMVAKRAAGPWVSARSSDWLKIKIVQEIDAVIGGFTAPRAGRARFGALLLGVYSPDGLRYIGGVGTGFDEDELERLHAALDPMRVRACPFTEMPKTKEKAYWTRPKLIARVRFAAWTHDDVLRHPVYLGLRDDVEPGDCTDPRAAAKSSALVYAPAVDTVPVLRSLDELEEELASGRRETVKFEHEGKTVRLTHLDKVYFPEPGYTKRHLLAYYFRIAPLLLPFLRDRPLVLHRFPNGVDGESFYQKDCGDGVPEWMDLTVIPSESSGRDTRYFVCNSLSALLHLTNLGSIEHHPWPSRIDDLESPDYVFFDLDPTETATYETVIEVARAILKLLDSAGLRAFLKTSGSKGMHLWLPLERDYDFEHARAFAEIVARVIHARLPEKTTLVRMVDKRPEGSIYLDYSQNAYGRPLATVYSVRPRPQATASAPLEARELRKGLRPEKFTISTMPSRLGKKGDLWAEFWESRQRIETALEKLGALSG